MATARVIIAAESRWLPRRRFTLRRKRRQTREFMWRVRLGLVEILNLPHVEIASVYKPSNEQSQSVIRLTVELARTDDLARTRQQLLNKLTDLAMNTAREIWGYNYMPPMEIRLTFIESHWVMTTKQGWVITAPPTNGQ